jgi:hypothetical protein
VLAAPAGAGSIGVELGLAPGKLTLSAQPVVLAADSPAVVRLAIADARGSGAGWTLALRASSQVDVLSIAATCGRRSTCSLPVAVGAPHAAVVLQASRGSGMGVVRLAVTLRARAATPVAFALAG